MGLFPTLPHQLTIINFHLNFGPLIIQHDAPVYTISYYAHRLLISSISEHGYHVSISGTGADELFSGYYDHYLAFLHDVQASPTLYHRYLLDWEQYVKPLVRNPYLKDPDLFCHNPDFRGVRTIFSQ